jgi:phosphatidylethanolamine/phosphatidyl-N-methylethanolamine N-methyltransferase
MDVSSIVTVYRRQAPLYDGVFGVLLGPGRRATVRLANSLPGRRLLEVGVGTGLSLPRYRNDLSITGIDISPDMLKIARRRAEMRGLRNVERLAEMDAEDMDFPDRSFDIVVAMYVASVVPHPDRLLMEMQRVCRPGGIVLVVNHFAATTGLRAWVERSLAPLSTKLGWRPDFAFDPFLHNSGLTVTESWRLPPLGLFTLLQCRSDRWAKPRPQQADDAFSSTHLMPPAAAEV